MPLRPAFFLATSSLLITATPITVLHGADSTPPPTTPTHLSAEAEQDLHTTGGPVGIAVDMAKTGADGAATRFNGYLRTGAGVNQDGGSMQTMFGSRLGRLGNEDSTYGELAVYHDLAIHEGARWFVGVRASFETSNDRVNESVAPGWPEAWIGSEGLVSPGSTLWVGKRFYRRKDIHITDYKYLDTSAPGAGLEDVDWGSCKTAVAVMVHGMTSTDRVMPDKTVVSNRSTDRGRPQVIVGDLRLYDVALTTNQTLEWDLIGMGSPSGHYVDATGRELYAYRSFGSGGLSTTHEWKHEHGRTISTIQGGVGSSDPFVLARLTDDQQAPLVDSSADRVWTPWLMRGVIDHATSFGKHWQLATAAVAETGNDGRADFTHGRFQRLDLVARPSYWWTDRWGIASEAGWSTRRLADIDPLNAVKFTLAPQVRVANVPFARPVLRAFGTVCWWSGNLTNYANDNGSLIDKSVGWNVGVQAEGWW